MGYKIAAGIIVLLFILTWYACVIGWGLPSTTAVDARRQAIASARSVRLGYVGTGPHYGK
jgi:hypothetical protein